MKRILEYLPVLTVCLIYFGFCNLHFYYTQFNINIAAYISAQDIWIGFFPSIVLVAATINTAITQLLFSALAYSKGTLITDEAKFNKQKDWLRKNLLVIGILFYAITLLALQLVGKYLHYKTYELQDWYTVVDLIFLVILYTVLLVSEKKETLLNNPILIFLFLVFFIGQRINNFRQNDAQKLKDGISLSTGHLSFSYLNKNVKVKDSLELIGQTTNYTFVYNRKDSSTSIYMTSKMDNLKIEK